MTKARLSVAAYVIGGMALPATAFLMQPRNCFRYLYGPTVVPLFAAIAVLAGIAQWVLGGRRVGNLVASCVFAVGVQFTVVVPCVSPIETSSQVRGLSLAGLVFGGAAAGALAYLAMDIVRHHGILGQWGSGVAATGCGLSAVVVAAGVAAIHLGVTSAKATWVLSVLARLNNAQLLLLGEALFATGIAAALVWRWTQGRASGRTRG